MPEPYGFREQNNIFPDLINDSQKSKVNTQ